MGTKCPQIYSRLGFSANPLIYTSITDAPAHCRLKAAIHTHETSTRSLRTPQTTVPVSLRARPGPCICSRRHKAPALDFLCGRYCAGAPFPCARRCSFCHFGSMIVLSSTIIVEITFILSLHFLISDFNSSIISMFFCCVPGDSYNHGNFLKNGSCSSLLCAGVGR